MPKTRNLYDNNISIVFHQQKFTKDIALLIKRATELDVKLSFGEAYRTIDQQLLYYYGMNVRTEDKRLNLLSGKTRSKTLYSNHMKRLAVDFNFFINNKLTYTDPLIEELGQYWESLDMHNRWGGNFKGFYDAPHFERNIIVLNSRMVE